MFSKYPILETFYQKYSVNGYAHKVQHGDWFCGKGVGLAKIVVDKLHVNVYVTHVCFSHSFALVPVAVAKSIDSLSRKSFIIHSFQINIFAHEVWRSVVHAEQWQKCCSFQLHAQYSKDKDEYLSHRVSQAFEFSQFIRLTSHDCDIIFAGGDFNLDPADTGYAIIGANAALEDAWVTQVSTIARKVSLSCFLQCPKLDIEICVLPAFQSAAPEDSLGTTCDRPDNKYACTSWQKYFPNGQRLDYIMYGSNRGNKKT